MKILTTIRTKSLDAGPKAPLDVIRILRDEYKDIKVETAVRTQKGLLWKLKRIILILKNILYKDIIIVQHPITQSKIIKLLPKKKTIILVHDLNSIRYPEAKNNENEIGNLKKFKYIIVHNQIMKNYLIQNGVDSNNIYILELFDYICDKNIESVLNQDNKEYKIIFAGNLEKSEFIYQLEENKMNFNLNLYGQGFKQNENNKTIYKGVFQPEKLPKEWDNNGIGLVWDGKLDETDVEFGVKNYTKYNNPHKLSCYLAAGIPVIVWEKAAIADFVIKNNVGFLIKNIYEINNLDFSDYEVKKENAKKISEKIRNGYFTKKIFKEVIDKM